ncbi:MAG: DUF922 domain-containing protein [Pseudomonadota bacterium]
MTFLRVCIAVFCAILVAPSAGAADWAPTERVDHYSISGTTPHALYQSIGERGPKTSVGSRAIAVTEWDLRWRRDYQRRGEGCVVASALPFLTITYKLPKPASALSGDARRRWSTFSAGIVAHEDVHGVLLRAMTDTIIRETVGLSTANDDGNCNALRARVLEKVAAAYDGYRRDSNAFDRIEMSPGGNVQQLVLGLLNGS